VEPHLASHSLPISIGSTNPLRRVLFCPLFSKQMFFLIMVCFSCSGYSQCEDIYLNKTKPVVKQQMVKDSVADNKDSGIMTKTTINEIEKDFNLKLFNVGLSKNTFC
jgi:hypothetical protein